MRVSFSSLFIFCAVLTYLPATFALAAVFAVQVVLSMVKQLRHWGTAVGELFPVISGQKLRIMKD